jgi:hypothetical protein
MEIAVKHDDPTEYFTTHCTEIENSILPLGWYEHGIELLGDLSKKWLYKLCLVNSLDATGSVLEIGFVEVTKKDLKLSTLIIWR